MLLSRCIKPLRPLVIIALRFYWWVFRPKTRGAKALLEYNEQFLLVKPMFGYKYTLPGGGVKRNESPEDGMRREIYEELGIGLAEAEFLGSFISTVEYKQDEVFAFYAKLNSDVLNTCNIEIESVKWLPLDQIKSLGPVSAKIIDLFKLRKNY